MTKEEDVICNDNQKSLQYVAPILHKESDTMMCVHTYYDGAVKGGKAQIAIKTDDTDIVIIAVYILSQLQY